MNTNIAYVVIASLLVMVFLITRNIKTVDSEYFVLDKTEKTFGLTMSFYASGMGLWILTSPAEVAWYGLGYDIYGYAISAATPFVLIYIFGPKISKLLPNGVTLAQFVEKKYGSVAQKIVSLVAVIYMSAFLIASGIVVAALVAATTFLYLNKSGFKASYLTDKIQGIGIILLLTFLFSIWFSQNSISEIADFAMLGGLNTFETYSLKSALAVIIAVTAAEIFSTGYWQRTFSAMNETTIKKASIYSGFGVFITILLLGIAGAVGAGKGLEIPTLSFINQLSLNSMTVLVLISLATLLVTSSVDTLENAISSTISIDLIRKGSREANNITLLVIILALFASTRVTNIFTVFLVADLLATSLVFPAFYRIRKTSKDILLVLPFVGSLVSVFVYRYLFINLEENPGGLFVPTDLYGLADLNTFAIALVSSVIITFVADRFTK